MYTIKRTSTTPNSPLRVMVDAAPNDDSGDLGMAGGGTFYFEPAGQDGDTAAVSRHAAQAIMHDPGLAVHFSCTPALPTATAPADTPADVLPAQDEDTAPKTKKGRKATEDD